MSEFEHTPFFKKFLLLSPERRSFIEELVEDCVEDCIEERSKNRPKLTALVFIDQGCNIKNSNKARPNLTLISSGVVSISQDTSSG